MMNVLATEDAILLLGKQLSIPPHSLTRVGRDWLVHAKQHLEDDLVAYLNGWKHR